MPMIEVVVDGTNFGGKTPLVARLIELLRARGSVVETASPYREVEVWSQWDDSPIGAARAITDIMRGHRRRGVDARADVFVWDRGWPTAFIATRNVAARAMFEPLPALTFILLNTAETTERKVRKYQIQETAYPWMHRHRLKDEMSYRELVTQHGDRIADTFSPTLDDSRFDLDLVAGAILDAVPPVPDGSA